jgi:hypothetical protein
VKPTIALFRDETSEETAECGDGIIAAFKQHFNLKIFTLEQCLPQTFLGVYCVVFPGGVGDSDDYDWMFLRKRETAIADFVSQGGAYLGICVGAYWAGSYYFDILDGIDAVQYIKQPRADIRRCYTTTARVLWQGEPQRMFFRDGCTFVGDLSKAQIISTYANGDPMCIRQGKIGVMGACPDSLESWYTPKIRPYWHQGRHHELLRQFVRDLIE